MNVTELLTMAGKRLGVGKLFIPQMFKKLLIENSETHKKLGEIPLLTSLGELNVSREQYLAALKKMYGLYAALEPKLETSVNWHAIGIDFNKRKRLPLLEKDFRCFGVTDKEIAEILLCDKLPEMDSLSKVLGCMAVIEGSTAGATATAQKLAVSNLHLEAGNGAAFFNNYGDRRNEMRTTFAKVVSEQNVNEKEFLSAGKQMFDVFYYWLSK